jgi:OmpA-OmpF porin, OOP family
MKMDKIFPNRWKLGAALSLLTVISTGGCEAVRNPALQRARDVYQQARRDPEVAGRAGVALDKAGQTLEEAERVWKTEKDATEAEHLAYIAEKRVEIARATARRRLAIDEIQQLKSPRQ